MATSKIVGITIDIEGRNSKMVSSLDEIQKQLNKTDAALKDVNKALQLDPTNVDLLAQKEELLNKQIEQTNEKLEIMQQVAEDAAKGLEEGTVTKEAYASLTAEIVKTNSSLETMKDEASGAGDALEDVDSGEIEEVAEDSEEAAESLQDVEEESGNAGKGLDALGVIAAGAGAAVAGATAAMADAVKEVAGALVDCTLNAGDYVDELNTLSQKTGVSTETLQEWNYVSGLIDVDVNTLTGSLTKLEKSMGSAAEQQFKYDTGLADLNRSLKEGKISHEEYETKVEELGEKTATAYDQLGIAIYDSNHNLRDNEEVMFEVLEALSQMPEGVERDLLSMQLLGKSAKELGPLLQENAVDKFKELSAEAHEVGYVMDEDTVGAFQEFDDQMERLGKSGQAAKNALGTVLLPSLNSLASTGTNALTKFTKAMQESNGDISSLGPVVNDMLKDILGEINKQAPQIFELIGSVVDTLLQILIDNLPQIVDSAMSILTSLTDTLINPENIGKIADAATTIIMSLVSYLMENLDKILGAALSVVTSLLQGISDNLPKLIPVAIDAILTFVETLLAPEQLSQLLDCSLQLIVGLATGLIDALPRIIERLPEIISGIIDFLLSEEGLGKLISTGFDLFVGLVTKMPEVIVDILEAVGGLIGDIVGKIVEKGVEVWDACKEMFPSLDDVMTWGSDMIHGIIDGITGALGDLWDACTDVASGIADFLGFSVPEKGPLHEWAYNNPGADMVKLWTEGVEDELPTLQSSLNLMANTIEAGTNPDYSDQLSAINGTLTGIASVDRQFVVPVYIGTDRIETIVTTAAANQTFLSGGR